jgi:hypothetical protein
MSTVVAKFKWLFPLVDGCHCSHITNLRGKKILAAYCDKAMSQYSGQIVFCIARLLPLQSSPQVHQKKKNNFSNWLCSQSHCLWPWTWARNLSAHKGIRWKCRWSYEQLPPVAPVVEIPYTSHAYSLVYPFVDLAYQSKNILCLDSL